MRAKEICVNYVIWRRTRNRLELLIKHEFPVCRTSDSLTSLKLVCERRQFARRAEENSCKTFPYNIISSSSDARSISLHSELRCTRSHSFDIELEHTNNTSAERVTAIFRCVAAAKMYYDSGKRHTTMCDDEKRKEKTERRGRRKQNTNFGALRHGTLALEESSERKQYQNVGSRTTDHLSCATSTRSLPL